MTLHPLCHEARTQDSLITYLDLATFNGICMVNVVPVPSVLVRLIDPPIKPAN